VLGDPGDPTAQMGVVGRDVVTVLAARSKAVAVVQDRAQEVDLRPGDARLVVDDPPRVCRPARGMTPVLRSLSRNPSSRTMTSIASISREVPLPHPASPENARSSAYLV